MISFLRNSYPGYLIVLIVLISTVSSASIGSNRVNREVEVGSSFHDEDAKQNLSSSSSSPKSSIVSTSLNSTESTEPSAVAGNGTNNVSIDSAVLEESENSTQADDSDVIYLTYPSSLFPYGVPVEEEDPSRWLWALDEALQKRREKEELDEFADELEELYTTELEEEYDEDYEEEDEGGFSDDDESEETDPKEDSSEEKIESSAEKTESSEKKTKSSAEKVELSESPKSS